MHCISFIQYQAIRNSNMDLSFTRPTLVRHDQDVIFNVAANFNETNNNVITIWKMMGNFNAQLCVSKYMTTIDVVSISKMASWILNNIGSGNGLLPNGTRPSLKLVLMFFNWTIGNKVRAHLKQNRKSLVGENVFENVVSKTVVYLVWHQCVDKELHLFSTYFYSTTNKCISRATDVVIK